MNKMCYLCKKPIKGATVISKYTGMFYHKKCHYDSKENDDETKKKIIDVLKMEEDLKMDIERMRIEALKSPCKVIKFSASDGEIFSHNGEFYADCDGCMRSEIVQKNPDCRANHAEWGVLYKSKDLSKIYIYCMTPDGKDYPFDKFWCLTCAILIPMFGVQHVFMWDNGWILHDPKKLMEEVNNSRRSNNGP